MSYKTLIDGSILFKDVPPFCPNGYKPDPNDLRHFIPDYDPCKHRVALKSVRPCGAIAVCWRCLLKNQITNMPECKKCEVREP